MGVYIKGITMPKGCYDCPMLEGDRDDGLCHAASKWLDDDEYWLWSAYPEGDIDDSKPANCPLIHVPDHGDLIDRDALDGVLLTNGIAGAITRRKIRYTVGDVRTMVGHAPVIIPAERSESDDEQ